MPHASVENIVRIGTTLRKRQHNQWVADNFSRMGPGGWLPYGSEPTSVVDEQVVAWPYAILDVLLPAIADFKTRRDAAEREAGVRDATHRDVHRAVIQAVVQAVADGANKVVSDALALARVDAAADEDEEAAQSRADARARESAERARTEVLLHQMARAKAKRERRAAAVAAHFRAAQARASAVANDALVNIMLQRRAQDAAENAALLLLLRDAQISGPAPRR